MLFTEQELKQIIKEETKLVLNEFEWGDVWSGAKSILSKGMDAAPEAAVGWIARQIVSMMPGVESDDWLAVTIGKSVGNISWDEWQKIIAGKGTNRCDIIAQNVGEGIVEAISYKLLIYLEKAITGVIFDKESDGGLELGDLMTAVGSPKLFAAQKGGSLAFTGALGITYEVIGNEIKSAAFFKDIINSMSGAICTTIEDLKKNPTKIFGG